MKKETGDWNDSVVNRPDASAGSAGSSTAGIDSLRSPGSFSSNSSDYGRHVYADQVGDDIFIHFLLVFLFFWGAIDIAKHIKGSPKFFFFFLPRRKKKLVGRVFFFFKIFFGHHFWGQKKM